MFAKSFLPSSHRVSSLTQSTSSQDLFSLCATLDETILDIHSLPLHIRDKCRSSIVAVIQRPDLLTAIEHLNPSTSFNSTTLSSSHHCSSTKTTPQQSNSQDCNVSNHRQNELTLSPKELQLASHLIQYYPPINKIRFQLVPSRLNELQFWRTLFGLFQSAIWAEVDSPNKASSTNCDIEDVDDLLDQLQAVLDKS